MFNFFRRAKHDARKRDPECGKEITNRTSDPPLSRNRNAAHGETVRPPESIRNGYQEQTTKDVINLLIPERRLEYGNRTSAVGGFFQRMAGGKRRGRNRRGNWSRCHTPVRIDREEADSKYSENGPILCDVANGLRNEPNENEVARATPTRGVGAAGAVGDADSDARAQADFVRDLVLEKYAARAKSKSASVEESHRANDRLQLPDDSENERSHCESAREPADTYPYKSNDSSESVHVNSNEPEEHAEEIMGIADSRRLPDQTESKRPENVPVPEIILELDENAEQAEEQTFTDSEDEESEEQNEVILPAVPVKSNLKIPKGDNCPSDDDSSVRSNDSAKKKVTFKKTIDFDDGDTQTDDEMDSTFESLSSESSSDDDSSDGPDNDETLGGEIVIVNMTDGVGDIIHDGNDDSDVSDRKMVEGDIPTMVSEYDSSNVDTATCESNEFAFEVESFDGSSTDGDSGGDEPVIEELDNDDNARNLVNQEGRFQEQVSQLTELAATRSSEADSLRWKLDEVKRELEVKDAGAERLRAELASAHKEAELVRQRLKFLEDELTATRRRSADLADQLASVEGTKEGATLSDVEHLRQRIKILEERLNQLELEKKALLEEKNQQECRAEEAIAAVAACEARWRRAHEKARTEASERAERVLADCEWKMRELERRAREADKKLNELNQTYEERTAPSPAPAPPASSAVSAELAQLRGLSHEQQRALRAAGAKAAAAEQREAALSQDLMRLRELLDRDRAKATENENKYKEELSSQNERIQKRLEEQRRALMTLNQNSVRLEVERVRVQMEKEHIEKQRSALQQQRSEHERAIKCVERRLKEAQTRLENLKDVLAKKESQFEHELAEARSTADWDLLQLRHLLDRADITYATSLDAMQAKHEKEIEKLNDECTEKLQEVEAAGEKAVGEARALLEKTKKELLAERREEINRLKDQHKRNMEQQWEDFMSDKEHCLARMKTECRMEGEEDRIKREKDLMAEIKEMQAEVVSKAKAISTLKEQLSSRERRFSVTDQELRDALAREQALRAQLIDMADRAAKSEQDAQRQIEHLTRKCACLTKLFEEMRSRLEARDAAAVAEKRSRDENLDSLRAEVSRLTARLAEYGPPGDRTSADGCDSAELKDTDAPVPSPDFFRGAAPHHSKSIPREPRRKGGGSQYIRRRAKSVDLPAVQVPVRIRQFNAVSKSVH